MDDEAARNPAGADSEPRSSNAAEVDRSGGFERYALLAALTLVVLCLLIWERRQGGASQPGSVPRPDRSLRVTIGGDPQRAQTGTVLKRQETVDPAPAPAPTPSPRRTYTVRSGDNLSSIATRELGSASRAKEIADLNGLADPGKLKTGQILELPAK